MFHDILLCSGLCQAVHISMIVLPLLNLLRALRVRLSALEIIILIITVDTDGLLS